MQNEPQAKTVEDLFQGNALEKIYTEMAKQLRTEKRRKMIWSVLALVIFCIGVSKTKSKTVWLPVADSQQMCVVVSDWWGLKAQAFYPVWRKPSGENAVYSEQWCVKYPDDTWHVFYDGHGEAPAYKYPRVTYSTYF